MKDEAIGASHKSGRVVYFLAILCGALVAQPCSKTALPVEQAICRQPELQQLDAELNKDYTALRKELPARFKSALPEQQRAWIKKRNQSCTTGEVECLRPLYQQRIEELLAMTASIEDDYEGNYFTKLVPVIVKGKWKVASIHDPAPAGSEMLNEKEVQESLRSDYLPMVGEVVTFSVGQVCYQDGSCNSWGWMLEKSAEDAGSISAELQNDLGVDPSSDVLIAHPGKFKRYIFIPRKDGTLWAIFSLWNSHMQDLRFAAEVWVPASKDAVVKY